MYLIAIAWIYVVLMMALAEALSTQGTVLGAVITFLMYGVAPLSVVLYIMGTPMRRRQRLAAEATTLAAADQADASPSVAPSVAPSAAQSVAPDGGSHAAGDGVAPVRKEP